MAVEGGTSDALQVRLTARPHGSVVLSFSAGDGQVAVGAAATDRSVISFDSNTWDAWQYMSVTAVNDEYAEAAEQASSIHVAVDVDGTADGVFLSHAVNAEQTVEVQVVDDDKAAVSFKRLVFTHACVRASVRGRPPSCLVFFLSAQALFYY